MNKWERTYGTLCGTDAGYQRHRRNGEQPCRECRTAHAQWMAKWRQDRREGQL